MWKHIYQTRFRDDTFRVVLVRWLKRELARKEKL